MKLYTEEQVRESYQSGFRLAMETDGGLKEGQQEFINSITPIELPSDEEINSLGASGMHEYYIDGLKDGAKWMRDKILNQNQ